MPIYQHEGNTYALTNNQLQDLQQGLDQWGRGWLHDYLSQFPPLLSARAADTAEPWVDSVLASIPPVYRKKKVAVEKAEPEAPLSFPIIPEVGEDGVKRLYKTRYNELEKKYATLHSSVAVTKRNLEKVQNDYNSLADEAFKLQRENAKLTRLTADSAKLDARISHLCTEAQITLPENPMMPATLEQKLDAFFGAILCRLRIEEIADELAD